MSIRIGTSTSYTLIKKKSNFPQEIQSGAVAKSYMMTGFLIDEDLCRFPHIYEEAVNHI